MDADEKGVTIKMCDRGGHYNKPFRCVMNPDECEHCKASYKLDHISPSSGMNLLIEKGYSTCTS